MKKNSQISLNLDSQFKILSTHILNPVAFQLEARRIYYGNIKRIEQSIKQTLHKNSEQSPIIILNIRKDAQNMALLSEFLGNSEKSNALNRLSLNLTRKLKNTLLRNPIILNCTKPVAVDRKSSTSISENEDTANYELAQEALNKSAVAMKEGNFGKAADLRNEARKLMGAKGGPPYIKNDFLTFATRTPTSGSKTHN